jgi:predicted nuclease of restriction endonuclease-like (RecB) superfamily
MLMNNAEYIAILKNVKREIRAARHRALVSANSELIKLYWSIGKIINEHSRWGSKFVSNLARDIKLEFPNVTGYSIRNLKYMAKFARLFPKLEIVQASLAQITWYHHIALMDKVKDTDQFIWYSSKTVENGWTRDVLVHQIEYGLYERQKIAPKTANKKGMIAEYALRDIEKPIGVSEYSLVQKLPKFYKDILPSAEDIEKRIGLSLRDGDKGDV